MENRKATRYQMRAPVIFQWTDQQYTRQQGAGFTRDISTSGLFVLCGNSPPSGAVLALEVVLPPLEAASQSLRLQASGQVVRVESSGFAAVSDLGSQSTVTNESG